MNLFTAQPNIAASFRFLPLENDVAFYRYFEAGTKFEGEVGKKGTFGNGFGVDGREERIEKGDAVTGRGWFRCTGNGSGRFGISG